jgi:hypothetical protein
MSSIRKDKKEDRTKATFPKKIENTLKEVATGGRLAAEHANRKRGQNGA